VDRSVNHLFEKHRWNSGLIKSFGLLVALSFGLLVCLLVCLLVGSQKSFGEEQGVALDIRWMGTDLVDELVHDWELHPPFSSPELASIAEINSPIGLDDRFSVIIENHLIDLLVKIPATNLRLARCSACMKMVVKSTKAGTYIGRGIDQPELLKELSSSGGSRKGLSLSFEAEGRALVLRAQLFSFAEPGQPIVWAKSYSTSMSSRLALQNDQHLVTLQEARQTQNSMIHKEDPLQFVTRMTFRNYKLNNAGNTGASNITPLLFVEQSVEGVLLPRRNYRTAFTVGATSIEKVMSGYSVGGHIAKLLNKQEPSLANPDLYLFGGFQYVRLRGAGATPFGAEELDIARIRGDKKEPRAAFLCYRVGLEVHMKHRLGLLAFLEKVPAFDKSDVMGSTDVLGLKFHGMGLGMVVKW
jgi:hypothetical protein